MILFPAIDIKDGKVVRLLQGKFDQLTEYSADPLSMARHWKKLGAEWLHLVDLDGAQSGEMKNISVIKQIVEAVGIPVEVGGGIRYQEIVDALLSGGIQRIVLGTKVIEDREFLKHNLKKAKSRLAVSVDCSKGFVSGRGWTETSKLKAIDFVKELENLGVETIIYTDISRDGTLKGPNFDGIKEILNTVKINVIASGGISCLDDVKRLIELKSKNLLGAITGKAIYEGKLDFKKAVELCSTNA